MRSKRTYNQKRNSTEIVSIATVNSDSGESFLKNLEAREVLNDIFPGSHRNFPSA